MKVTSSGITPSFNILSLTLFYIAIEDEPFSFIWFSFTNSMTSSAPNTLHNELVPIIKNLSFYNISWILMSGSEHTPI